MTHTTNLTPDRLDQLRTFLVTEAVADTAASRRPTGPASHRRRVAVVAVAAVLLGGGLVVSTLAPGGTEPALAITTEDDWTTVRLADVEADAQRVVDELVAAGIDARLVSDGGPWSPSSANGTGALGSWWPVSTAESDAGPEIAGIMWMTTSTDERDFGLAIDFPPAQPAEPASGEYPFEAAGVRIPEEGDDWTFSIRSDSGVSVLVWDN